jgi:predicted CXXCH cytochrome family protein
MKKFNPSLRVDQVQEYFTSVHGQRLRMGDQKVATCVSCHGVHGIRAPGDPQSQVYALNVADTCAKCHANPEHMAGYDIPNDQFAKYKTSVHARALLEKHDLSAPTCNDCHGNHGAVPPGIESVANVCGQCHGRQAELFQKSPHRVPFESLKMGQCLRCHSNHDILPPTDAMAGVGQRSVCTSCHNGDAGFAAAQRIGKGLTDLQSNIDSAKELLERAERAGMEVSRPKFELRDASDGLTQARVLVHTSSPDEIENAIAPAMEVAAKSFQAGEGAFAELSFRRKGLVVSLLFILFLTALVYLKIRQIEGKSPFANPA